MHRYKGPIFSLVTIGAAMAALLGSGAAASASNTSASNTSASNTSASNTSAANTSAAWARAYVSPHGSSRNAGNSCRTARFTSINAAIAAVRSHGTVIVCRGIYHTQAVIKKPLTLIGERAVINAKGQKPVLPKLPGGSGIVVLGTRHVTIEGFRVTGAGFDAILVALSAHVRVTGNVLEHNGDVGVDFNGSSLSIASHNVSNFNKGGGFLVADDIGAARGNTVSWNVASHNPGGCGVIIAGHSKFGVRDNRVAHNLLTYNGTLPKSSGAGVVIATEVPGETVSGNTVAANRIYGNGIAGVTIHSHVKGQNLNGNRIVRNWIGRNNVVGDPIGLGPPVTNVPDLRTTGILVGASSRVHVTISGNHISRNWYGIFLEGRVSATLHRNHFRRVHTPVKFVT
jgi:parallel beta-helix repeat protein